MTVNDVDLVMQPTAQQVGFITQPSGSRKRTTFQHFNNNDLVDVVAPHNSDARSSSAEWPPPLIFDAAYGCAAFRTWGIPVFIDFARTQTRIIYYNNDDGSGHNCRGHDDRHGNPDNSRSEKCHQQATRGETGGKQATLQIRSQILLT